MFIIAITAKEKVFGYLSDMTPDEIKHLDNSQIYAAYPLIKKDNIRKIKKEFLKSRTVTQTQSQEKTTTGGRINGVDELPRGSHSPLPPSTDSHHHDSSTADDQTKDGSPSNGTGGERGTIPEDIIIRARYMQYFKDKGLKITFNEIDTYLTKNNLGGSELAQQMSTDQLLAVINPRSSLPPANSALTSLSMDSTSLTKSVTNNDEISTPQ